MIRNHNRTMSPNTLRLVFLATQGAVDAFSVQHIVPIQCSKKPTCRLITTMFQHFYTQTSSPVCNTIHDLFLKDWKCIQLCLINNNVTVKNQTFKSVLQVYMTN